jgi:hypothetical protein
MSSSRATGKDLPDGFDVNNAGSQLPCLESLRAAVDPRWLRVTAVHMHARTHGFQRLRQAFLGVFEGLDMQGLRATFCLREGGVQVLC